MKLNDARSSNKIKQWSYVYELFHVWIYINHMQDLLMWSWILHNIADLPAEKLFLCSLSLYVAPNQLLNYTLISSCSCWRWYINLSKSFIILGTPMNYSDFPNIFFLKKKIEYYYYNKLKFFTKFSRWMNLLQTPMQIYRVVLL